MQQRCDTLDAKSARCPVTIAEPHGQEGDATWLKGSGCLRAWYIALSPKVKRLMRLVRHRSAWVVAGPWWASGCRAPEDVSRRRC